MGRESASASPGNTCRRRQTPLRGRLLISFQKRQFILSSVCAAKAGPRSHPLSESQEVPVRINIAFYTSKELLMGGQRQEAEQEEVAAGPQLLRPSHVSHQSHLHFPERRGWADVAQEQSEPLKDTVPHKEAGVTQHSWLLAAVQVASWMPLPLSGKRTLQSEIQSQASSGKQSLRFLPG